jgi:hypothetical protein
MVGECIPAIRNSPGNRLLEARRRSQNRRPTRAPASLRERRSNRWVAMMNDIDELIASAAADLEALTRKLDRLRTISAQRQAAPIAQPL